MNKRIFLSGLFFLVAPFFLFAEITVSGDVWHMSGLAPEELPEWNELFRKAEELSSQKDYTGARLIVDGLLENLGTNQFKLKNGDDAELTLAAWRLRLFVREPKNLPFASKEIDDTIQKYAKKAKGKRSWAYKRLFIISEDFHYHRQERKKHDEALANCLLYDPNEGSGVFYLIDSYFQRPWNFEPMTNFWAKYDQIGGRSGADVEMVRIFTTGERKDKIEKGLRWLNDNADAGQNAIGLCLKGIDLNLSGDVQEEKLYRAALYKLALSNTNEIARLPISSMALQELEKLDAINRWFYK